MPRSPQDVYARLLSSPRGYPLWTPEPSNELSIQRSDGLKIGDVGVVIPDDGGFDVFFNICLPPNHPFHRRYGVPQDFTFINPSELDIRTIPNAEYPGRIISTSSIKRVETAGRLNDTPQRHVLGSETARPHDHLLLREESNALAYRFSLSSNEGALLILPKGADRYDLLNEGLFAEQASRHGAEWYDYAVNRRHRIINHDSLYLITGFHKAHSWSVASFENAMGNESHTAHFKRVRGYGAEPTYSWETTCALDWRVGPHIECDVANQAVFIRGLKIALRTGFLGARRISVEADCPSTRPIPAKLSSIIPSNSRLLDSFSRSLRRDGGNNVSRTNMHNLGTTDSPAEQPHGDGPSGRDNMHVEIQRVPDILAPFHPSSAINQYLFRMDPSANIAVTSDNLWMSILEDGLLTFEEFEQESRLEEALSHNYHIISENSVVRLERKSDPDALDDNEPMELRGIGKGKAPLGTPMSDVSETLGAATRQTQGQHSHQQVAEDDNGDVWSVSPTPEPATSTEDFGRATEVDDTSEPSLDVIMEPSSSAKNPPEYFASTTSLARDIGVGDANKALVPSWGTSQPTSGPFVSPFRRHTTLDPMSMYQRGQPMSIRSPWSTNHNFFSDAASASGHSVSTAMSLSALPLQKEHKIQGIFPHAPVPLPPIRTANPASSYPEPMHHWKYVPENAVIVDGPRVFVPQDIYQPQSRGDKERYVSSAILQPPIIFSKQDSDEWGVPVQHLLLKGPAQLLGGDTPAFTACGPSIGIRVLWPGYPSCHRQVSTRDYTSKRNIINKEKLAKLVAKSIKQYMDAMSVQVGSDPRWRVGPHHIKVEDVVLVSLHHVSQGSWQPHLRLRFVSSHDQGTIAAPSTMPWRALQALSSAKVASHGQPAKIKIQRQLADTGMTVTPGAVAGNCSSEERKAIHENEELGQTTAPNPLLFQAQDCYTSPWLATAFSGRLHTGSELEVEHAIAGQSTYQSSLAFASSIRPS